MPRSVFLPLQIVLFGFHSDYQYVGCARPLRTPSHPSLGQEMKFREGVIVDMSGRDVKSKYAFVGLDEVCLFDVLRNTTVEVLRSSAQTYTLFQCE